MQFFQDAGTLTIQVSFLAFVIESLIETGKAIKNWREAGLYLFATGLGIVACFTYKVDLFQELGFSQGVTYFGIVMTGAIAGRGTNFVHNLFKTLHYKAETAKTAAEFPMAPYEIELIKKNEEKKQESIQVTPKAEEENKS